VPPVPLHFGISGMVSRTRFERVGGARDSNSNVHATCG